jgi:hypothetical protein
MPRCPEIVRCKPVDFGSGEDRVPHPPLPIGEPHAASLAGPDVCTSIPR